MRMLTMLKRSTRFPFADCNLILCKVLAFGIVRNDSVLSYISQDHPGERQIILLMNSGRLPMASCKESLWGGFLGTVKLGLVIQRTCILYVLFAQLASSQNCEPLPCYASIAQYTVASYVPPDLSTTSQTIEHTLHSTRSTSHTTSSPAHHTISSAKTFDALTTIPSTARIAHNVSSTALAHNVSLAQSSSTKPTSLSQSSPNATSSTNCGPCSVAAQQVQVFYWSTASVKSDCARASSAILPTDSLSYGSNATKTLGAPAGQITTDVIDGFT